MKLSKRSKRPKKKRSAAAAVTPSELTRLGGALRALGGLAGGSIGALAGHPSAGASIGNSLGGALSRWLGSGDYTVGSNSIVSRAQRGSEAIPMMHNTGQTVTIRHKEYIGEIRSSINFTVQDSFQINPGNNRTFPWLSGVAARFQEYRIKGMVYHYIPSSGNVATASPSLGTVMIQTSYRSNDAAPGSKVELLNEYCSSESVPFEPFCHPIECDPRENPFNVQYVRTGEVPAEDSRLLYDLGVTHVCTSGQQADGNVLGDLWCTYEVELKKPIVASNVTATVRSAAINTSGAITASNWFTGGQFRRGYLDVTASGKTVTFPEGALGEYLIVVRLRATTTFSAADLTNTITYTNCQGTSVGPTLGDYFRNVLGGAGGTLDSAIIVAAIWIKDPALAASVTFGNVTLTGASTSSDLLVTPFTSI